MHYQQDVFDLVFEPDRAGQQLRNALIDRCNQAISGARKLGWPIIFANFVVHYDDQNGFERNKLVTALATSGRFRNTAPLSELDRQPDDTNLACSRVSVFYRTSLNELLKGQGIESLVMAGVTSSGVVLSSLAWASDADYRLYLIRCCCYDPDVGVHESLFETAFATRANIC
jgi:nicotinamidase-related amidase